MNNPVNAKVPNKNTTIVFIHPDQKTRRNAWMEGEQKIPHLFTTPAEILAFANYNKLVGGGTVCIPFSTQSTIPNPNAEPVAAGQEAKVEGDPHVTEADGGRFDFQGQVGKTYNLINDTGFTLNAKFQSYDGSDRLTTMGEIGGIVSGPGGTSAIQINAQNIKPFAALSNLPVNGLVSVNGAPVNAGESVRLADGGSLSVSKDGKTVTMTTQEGYQNTITLQVGGGGTYLDYFLRSGGQGVAKEGRMPGGLVGHTFDADPTARNGKTGEGAQGEGAIDGVYTDYEVPGGLLGRPQPQVMKAGAYPDIRIMDPAYENYFGLPVGTSTSMVPEDQIQEMWNQINADSMNQQRNHTLLQNTASDGGRIKKMEMLLTLALQGGNIDLAMLLLSGLETAKVNQLSGALMMKIKDLQTKRKGLVEQMARPENKDNQGEIQKLNNQAGDVSTEISMLQTFIQDLMAQKSEAQQMSSNILKTRHDTAQAIVRNMG